MQSVVGKTSAPASRPRARRGGRRPLVILFVVAIVAIGAYLAYDRFFKPQPAPVATTQPVAVSRGSIVATVSTTGSVVPARTADLSFNPSGRLAELTATVGASVKQGDVLARLETADLELQIVQAKAQLSSAEAKLASLLAGSSEADVAQARAQLKSAQTKLNQLKAGATAADLQAAQASVTSARGQLEKAQTDLAKLRAGLTEDETTSARIAIERAKISLHNAQVAYDKIAWRADAGATKEAMDLWQATVDYQTAEISYNTKMAGPTALDLTLAEGSVTSAQAQLASAEAKLATLKQGATEEELATAEAAVIQAQNQLDLKLSPPAEADVLSARASVEQAKAGLQTAQRNLENATMVAPFDGVVSAATGSVGANVSGTVVTLLDVSAPQLQVTMAETDIAKVEVGMDAVLTFEALGGQQLPGKVLSINPRAAVQSGVATYTVFLAIENPQARAAAFGAAAAQRQGAGSSSGQAPAAGSSSGQAPSEGSSVRPGQSGGAPTGQAQGAGAAQASGARAAAAAAAAADLSKIRPGMTASASIVYLRKDNVLVVPNRALRAQGRERVVDVPVDGKTETRPVTVGVADQSNTEIVAGLQEGEQVLISGTTTTTSTSLPRGQQGGQFVVPPGGQFIPGQGGQFVPPQGGR